MTEGLSNHTGNALLSAAWRARSAKVDPKKMLDAGPREALFDRVMGGHVDGFQNDPLHGQSALPVFGDIEIEHIDAAEVLLKMTQSSQASAGEVRQKNTVHTLMGDQNGAFPAVLLDEDPKRLNDPSLSVGEKLAAGQKTGALFRGRVETEGETGCELGLGLHDHLTAAKLLEPADRDGIALQAGLIGFQDQAQGLAGPGKAGVEGRVEGNAGERQTGRLGLLLALLRQRHLAKVFNRHVKIIHMAVAHEIKTATTGTILAFHNLKIGLERIGLEGVDSPHAAIAPR